MTVSVAAHLELDDGTDLLDAVCRKWSHWLEADGRLDKASSFEAFRRWLLIADRADSDLALVTLAELAAPDGGDDVLAAAALAKCLLPAACRTAGWLSTLPVRELFRDSQPVEAGACSAVERIDELVAAQLWIEVRSFRWRHTRNVAANVRVKTRVGVLRQLGGPSYLAPTDRVWGRTTVLGSLTASPGELGEDNESGCGAVHAQRAVRETPAMQASLCGRHLDDVAAADTELQEVLSWGRSQGVIDAGEYALLECLIEEAQRVESRVIKRGCYGLLSTELSLRVAPRLGLSEATVRRRASRSIRALAAAAPEEFSHAG